MKRKLDIRSIVSAYAVVDPQGCIVTLLSKTYGVRLPLIHMEKAEVEKFIAEKEIAEGYTLQKVEIRVLPTTAKGEG